MKKEIDLKLRGGVLEKVRVKYEKLPVFCYVCGKLGHGEKDCEEMTAPDPCKHKFSEKLRASPWQVNKGEMIEEESGSLACAHQLFVTKKQQAKRTSSETAKSVTSVAEQLGNVSLSLAPSNGQKGQTVEVEADKVQAELGSGVVLGTTCHDALGEHVTGSITFNMGSKSDGGKKFRRVKRAEPKLAMHGDTGQGVVPGTSTGKRKDFMEIDDDEGPKKTKLAEGADGTNASLSVAAVAVQPRKHQ